MIYPLVKIYIMDTLQGSPDDFYGTFTGLWITFMAPKMTSIGLLRETVSLLTSDMGQKTVSVLAHSFLLPQRANLRYILSIYPLRYSRS